MATPRILSNLILLLDNLDGSVEEPDLTAAPVANLAALKALYSTALGVTPESTIKSESEELEFVGQADDGTVALAELISASPKLQIEADMKDISEALLDRLLGVLADGALNPAQTYKAWMFWAVCSRQTRLTFEANVISAVRLIRCACTYTVKGDVTANGKELANAKLMITVDLSKTTTQAASIDTSGV